jgi:hypothetical protein
MGDGPVTSSTSATAAYERLRQAIMRLERFLSANRTIHLTIAEATGNRRAARIVERLLDDSERARLVALRAGAASRGVRARDELQSVLTELEAGNGPRAAELMATAIGAFRDELVESLQRAAHVPRPHRQGQDRARCRRQAADASPLEPGQARSRRDRVVSSARR